MRFLRKHLTTRQKRSLKKDGNFEVIGQSGIRYVIDDTGISNVLDTVTDTFYCVVFEHEDLPYGDVMLMQKLMLETDEQRFLRIAVPVR